jgi:hypothetical protein
MARGISSQPTLERKWQIENDADTLKRAAEIEMDQKRAKPAKAHLNKMQKYINKAIGKK